MIEFINASGSTFRMSAELVEDGLTNVTIFRNGVIHDKYITASTPAQKYAAMRLLCALCKYQIIRDED